MPTDPRHCTHPNTVPVDVRNHHTGATETVAHLCADCLDQLPPNWACTNCEWIELDTRTWCDPHPVIARVCDRFCEEHA